MSQIAIRLKNILTEKEISASRFAQIIDVQPSSLSHIFSGRNKPSIDLIEKIGLKFPDIDINWLIFGGDKKTSLKTEKSGSPQLASNIYESINENQQSTSIETKEKNTLRIQGEEGDIERIVIFYNNGSFKEYKNPS